MDNQLGSAAEGTMNKLSGEAANNPVLRVEGQLANPINITENADSIITMTMDRVEETLKALQKFGKIPSSPALGPLTVSRPFVAAPFIMLNRDRISSPLSDLDSTQGDNSPDSRGYSFRVLSVGDVQLTPDVSLATGRSLTDLRTPLEDNSLPSIEFGNFGSGLNPGEIQICNLEAPIKVFTEQKVQRNTVGELQLVERIEVVGDGIVRGSGDFVKLVPAIDNVGIEPVPVLSTRHEVFLGAGQILIERTTRLIQNPRRGGYRQNAAGHIEYYTFKSDLQDVSNRVGGVAPRVETIPDSKYGLIGPLKITTRREMQRLHDGDYRTKDIITIEIIRNSNEPTTPPDANVDAVEIPFKDRDYTESDGNGTKKVIETVKFGDGSLIITRVLEIAAFNGYNSYRIAIPRVWCVRESLPTIRGSMATPPPPASQQPGTVADGVAQTHHGIDAALQAILNNQANAHNIDVVAVANHLTVNAIDSIETTLKAYRNFGRPISIQGPSAKPLTVTSPYARRVALSRSPFSTRTARGTPRSNVSSTRTAQEISPGSTARSQFSPRTARAISPEPLTAHDRSPGALVSPGEAIRTAAAAGSFTSLDTRQYQTAVEPSLRSDPNVSTARPMLTGDDTSAQGSAATTTPSSLRTARRLSPLAGSSTSDQPRKLTPAEQWANVKPGPGPRIVPASAKKSVSNTSVHTAREKKPVAAASGSRLVPNKTQSSKKLWDDLVQAAKAAGAPIEAKSPGLAAPPARDESPVSTCRPLEETISETNIHTAITRSPVPSYQAVGNLEASSTTFPVRGATNVITGRGLSARDQQDHTAHATSPLRGATVTGRGLSARDAPHTAQAATSPLRGATDAQSGRGLSAREALARTPKKVSSATQTGREASKRASRVSIDRTNKSDSTRTGLEASSRAGIEALNLKPSYHAGLEGSDGASTRTGREASNRSGRDASARGGLKQPANVLFEHSDKSGRDASTRTGLEASTRTGLEASARGSSTKSSDYAGLDVPAGSGGAASTRTGLEASKKSGRDASNRSGREHFNQGRHFPHVVDSSTQTVHTGLEASTQTGKSARSPHPGKSATRTPTAKEPSTSTARLVPKSPSKHSSKSNVHSSGYPTAISAGPNTRNLRTAQGTQTDPTTNDKSVSTHTGKDLSAPKKKKKRPAKGEERSRRRQGIEAGQQPSESATGSISESEPRKLRSSSSQTSQKSSGFPTAREQTSPVVRTAVENPIKQGLAPPSHLGLPSPPSSTLASSRDVNQNPSQLRPNESFHTAKSGSWHTLPTTESPAPRSKNSNAIRTGRSPAPNSISNAIPGGAPQSPGVATAYSPGPRTVINVRSPAPQSISNARAGNAYPQSPGFGSNAQAGAAYPPASPGVATAYSPGPRTAVLARSPAPQSISNARARTASERSTGYPAADGLQPQDYLNARSGDIKVARSPGTAKAYSPSTRTGVQALTPKASASALQKSSASAVPKSSGTRTGVLALSPAPKSCRSGLPQDQQADASTRTGRSLSERSSGYPTAVSPGFPIDDGLQAIRTCRSPAPQTISNARAGDVNVARSPGTAKPYSPSSNDAGLASPSTRTGVQALTPKSSASAVPKSSSSALKSPSTRTGVQALSPKPSMSALGLKSSRSLAPKSSGTRTAVQALSPKPSESALGLKSSRSLAPKSSGVRTGVQALSPKPSQSALGLQSSRSAVPKTSGTRTGILAQSPAPGSGRSGLPQDQLADASTRTGRLLSEQASDPSAAGLQASGLPQDARPADASTRTGRLLSQQASPTAGFLQNAAAGAPQDFANVHQNYDADTRSPSTRTGIQAQSPAPKSGSSAFPNYPAADASTRTGRLLSDQSNNYPAADGFQHYGAPQDGQPGYDADASGSSSTRTGVQALTPKSSASAVPKSSSSALKSPSTRTGVQALSPKPSMSALGLKSSRSLAPKSSGTRTAVQALSPKPSESALGLKSSRSLAPKSSGVRTGVLALSPKPSQSALGLQSSRSAVPKTSGTRTGILAQSSAPGSGRSGLPQDQLADASTRTGRLLSEQSSDPSADGLQASGLPQDAQLRDAAVSRSPKVEQADSSSTSSSLSDQPSDYPSADGQQSIPAGAQQDGSNAQPGDAVVDRSPSSSKAFSSSTRTGVQALTPKSSASAVPKSSSSALKSPSTRTGVQALSPKPSMSALGLKSSRSLAPKSSGVRTAVPALSPKPSQSALGLQSSRSAVPKTSGTRTGILAKSPAPGSNQSGLLQDQQADASTRTGRLLSEQSGFPNADGLQQPGEAQNAQPGDSVNARSASTRSPSSKSNQLVQPKVEIADLSVRTGRSLSDRENADGLQQPGQSQDGQPGNDADASGSSSTRTGVQALTPKSSASAVPKSSSSALKSPSTRTGVQALSPKPSMSALGLKSSRSLAPKSSGTRTAVQALSPKPSESALGLKSSLSLAPKSSGVRTGVQALSPKPSQSALGLQSSRSAVPKTSGTRTGILAQSPAPATGRSDLPQDQFADNSTLRTGRLLSEQSSDPNAAGLQASAYPQDAQPRDAAAAAGSSSTRTGVLARSPAPSSNQLLQPKLEPADASATGSLSDQSSEYPSADGQFVPAGAQQDGSNAQPGEAALARSPSSSKGFSSSTRTGVQALTPKSSASAVPKSSSSALKSPSTRTGVQALSPKPSMSALGLKSSRSLAPKSSGVRTGVAALSPKPSVSAVAKSSQSALPADASTRTGRSISQMSSGYPTAHSPGPDTLKSLNAARSPINEIRAGLAPSAYHALAIPDSTPPDSPVTTAQLLDGARTGLQDRSLADKSSSSALPQQSPSTRTGIGATKSSASMLPKSSRSVLPPASPGVATAHSPGPHTTYARSPAPQSISNARAGNAYPPASPGVATAYSPGPSTNLQARSPAPQSISNARAGNAYPQSPGFGSNARAGSAFPPASPGVATAYSPGPRTAIQARSPAPQSISNARPGNARTPTQVSSGYPTARSPGFDVKECFDAIKNARSPARQAAAAAARGSYGQSPVKTGNEPSERSTRTANRPSGAASAISGHRLSPNLNLDPSQSLFGHSVPPAGSTPAEGIIAGDVGQLAPQAGNAPSEADVALGQQFEQPQQPGRRRRSGGRAPRSARTVSPNVFTAVSPGGSQRSSGLPTALSPGYSSGADMKTEELFPILDPATVPARNLLPVETPPGYSPPKSPYVGALPIDSSRAPADTYAPANIGRLAPSPGMTTGVSPLVASTNSPVQIALNPATGLPAPVPAPQPDGQDDGVDTVSVESSDEGETIASALSVTIDNTHIDPATGRRRRRMRPKRIVLNGEEVWKKPQ